MLRSRGRRAPPGTSHPRYVDEFSPQAPVFAALEHRGFRAFVLLSAAAMLADNVEHVITYFAAYQKFHSPTLGGIAVIAHWAPYLLLSIPVGALADRVDHRRLIQAGMLFSSCVAAWGLLIATGRLQIWHAEVLLVPTVSRACCGCPARS